MSESILLRLSKNPMYKARVSTGEIIEVTGVGGHYYVEAVFDENIRDKKIQYVVARLISNDSNRPIYNPTGTITSIRIMPYLLKLTRDMGICVPGVKVVGERIVKPNRSSSPSYVSA